ncbi:hypothetical protein VM1G_10694 [Cytospora mali]|uniref:DUF7029 domain-containing protein n=1 Tax=Cytospora mali TaxID=578113 RepID=A0A194VJ00_CYTMA|nr:hypothetical protein VM1G_10694 [Valsa mali]
MGVAYAAPAPSVVRSENATTITAPPKLALVPVASTNRNLGVGRNIAPTKNLNLAWQTPDNASLVAVALSMQHPAVVLEDVDDVASVDCTGQAYVSVTFKNTDAFNEALSSWRGLNDSFVFVTNHLGDCDAELERSFFVADTDTLASYEGNLTIIAQAEKKDVYSTAESTDINFNNVPTSDSNVDKRGISLDKEGLSIAYNYTTPSEQTILVNDYVTVVLHEAEISNSASYAGHVKWGLVSGVTEFTIDIDKSMWHHADLTFDISTKWTDTFRWAPDPLTYSVLEIPGILSLGPSAGISFGGQIIAEAGGSVTTDFTSSTPNGTIHLDFINWDDSTSSGWTPDHEATFNVTEDVQLTLKPFVDFTVEFACNLFDGLIDLSTGVKAEPSFPFVTTATATQAINSTGAVTFPNTTCANGLSQEVEFGFEIVAFATNWVNATLYDYSVDLYKGCINLEK